MEEVGLQVEEEEEEYLSRMTFYHHLLLVHDLVKQLETEYSVFLASKVQQTDSLVLYLSRKQFQKRERDQDQDFHDSKPQF